MKHKKIITVPAREKEFVEKITCDLCGMDTMNPSKYDIDTVTIEHELGCSFPEGGSTETVSIDMCTKCFYEKLIPWLESQNAKVYKEEHDW